jgi:hypothetical protein
VEKPAMAADANFSLNVNACFRKDCWNKLNPRVRVAQALTLQIACIWISQTYRSWEILSHRTCVLRITCWNTCFWENMWQLGLLRSEMFKRKEPSAISQGMKKEKTGEFCCK